MTEPPNLPIPLVGECIEQRCSAELTAAVNKSNHIKDKAIRKAKITALLLQTPAAIIECYQDKCHLCQESSLVCFGEKKYEWPKHFTSSVNKNKIKLTDSVRHSSP